MTKGSNDTAEVPHPIRDASVIDTVVTTDRGAYYGLVIASPVSGDVASQERLLNKISAYIGDFHSEGYISRFGKPSMESCQITVGIHPKSDPIIFELLGKCKAWVEDNNIRFVVKTDILGQVSH